MSDCSATFCAAGAAVGAEQWQVRLFERILRSLMLRDATSVPGAARFGLTLGSARIW
jgi:hypothetical protein